VSRLARGRTRHAQWVRLEPVTSRPPLIRRSIPLATGRPYRYVSNVPIYVFGARKAKIPLVTSRHNTTRRAIWPIHFGTGKSRAVSCRTKWNSSLSLVSTCMLVLSYCLKCIAFKTRVLIKAKLNEQFLTRILSLRVLLLPATIF